MSNKNPRVDDYIAKSADFAKPVLLRLRKLVHAACPDVTETIKWGAPFYEHKGILICTPAFKKHCAVIFWKGKLLFQDFPAKDNPRKKFRRLTSNADLPGDKILTGYIKQAIALNEAGVKTPRSNYFLAALKKNKKALATFENFSPSAGRDYVAWLAEAKREATRAQRLQTAIERLAAGKSRHWKYQR
jgi:hypothetical protein